MAEKLGYLLLHSHLLLLHSRYELSPLRLFSFSESASTVVEEKVETKWRCDHG